MQAIADELRAVDYKATGTLQRSIDSAGKMSRGEFDALLDAMVRARLIEIEEAEFEKEGTVIRFRKARLTEAGLEVRASSPVELLISDGVVDEFAGQGTEPTRTKKTKTSNSTSRKNASAKPSDTEQIKLSTADEVLAARLKEWRMAEAKQLRVPAYVVLHDRALNAIAQARPANPKQLMEISGVGPAKVERFGAAILKLLGD